MEGLEPVYVNQLYVHHILGGVVSGTGAESIRNPIDDASFPKPYGMLSGDFSDLMVFHLIDLRETGDKWLECLECRCKDDDGFYLDIGGGGEPGSTGGIDCCTNCTSLVSPTVDYRLRYNVTWIELSDLEEPVKPVTRITADIAPAVDERVEFDVPQFDKLPLSQRSPNDPTIQVLTRTGPLSSLFMNFGINGDSFYIDADELEVMHIHRCVSHLHIAGIDMYLEDVETGAKICEGKAIYGDDPSTDLGFVRSVSPTNYDVPYTISTDSVVRLVSRYNATTLHTGVMGLLTLYISEDAVVGESEAKLTVDLCSEPFCDATLFTPVEKIEQPSMSFWVLHYACKLFMEWDEVSGGCDGDFAAPFGDFSVQSVCADYCDLSDQTDKDPAEVAFEASVRKEMKKQVKQKCHYATKDCTEFLKNIYNCGNPLASGYEDIDDRIADILSVSGQDFALENALLGDENMHRLNTAMEENVVLPCKDIQNSLAQDSPSPDSLSLDSPSSQKYLHFISAFLFLACLINHQ